MEFINKIFVVTGAGGGIGSELVSALLERKAKVIALDLRPELLKSLSKTANHKNLFTYPIDITDQDKVNKLARSILAKHKKIDGLINGAGIIQPFIKINALTNQDINRVMNVNFFGTLNVIRAFLPNLTKRPQAYLVNISSMGGFLPVPGQSLYGASKSAVKLLTESLYAELANTHVQVSVVFPGAIETNITANSGVEAPKINTKQPSIKMTSAKTAAETIIKGIEKNKFQIFIGNDAKFMNLLYRLSPKKATDLIAKQMRSLLK